jgi:prepilin-type N-terminal cleavage/methylation domain-containing protein
MNKGFSLIEIIVVLIILSLLFTLCLGEIKKNKANSNNYINELVNIYNYSEHDLRLYNRLNRKIYYEDLLHSQAARNNYEKFLRGYIDNNDSDNNDIKFVNGMLVGRLAR